MKTKVEEREKAIILRGEGQSVNKIAKILNVSKGSVSLWVRNIDLTDEQKYKLFGASLKSAIATSRSMSAKYKNIREEWQKKGILKAKENDCGHASGCMLYWGEGSKSKNTCGLGNSDPNVVKFFVDFIKKYFEVSMSDFRIDIRVYLGSGLEINEIKEYWKSYLGINEDNITHVKILNGERFVTGRKKNIYKYGICNVRIHRTDIVQHIFGAIKEYAGIENNEWIDRK